MPPDLKTIWWNYLNTVGFFKDCFSVMMWSFLGIQEDKLGPHYMRISNMVVSENIKMLKKSNEDKRTPSLMIALCNNEFYYTDSWKQ